MKFFLGVAALENRHSREEHGNTYGGKDELVEGNACEHLGILASLDHHKALKNFVPADRGRTEDTYSVFSHIGECLLKDKETHTSAIEGHSCSSCEVVVLDSLPVDALLSNYVAQSKQNLIFQTGDFSVSDSWTRLVVWEYVRRR